MPPPTNQLGLPVRDWQTPSGAEVAFGAGQLAGDTATHAVNSLLLNIPQQVAEGKGFGAMLDKKLGGALTAMVEAAGGKQKLQAALARYNPMGDVLGLASPLAATKALKMAPGLKAPIAGLEKMASGIPTQGLIQGTAGAIAGSGGGAEGMALGGGLGVAGGVGGAMLGKVAAAPFKKITADPVAAEKKIGQGAKASWMATSIPGLGKRELKQFYKQDLGTFGGGERVAEKMAQDADLIKAKGLDDPRKMDEFKAAQPARWQAAEAEMAKLGDNGRLVAFNKDIEALPEVQEYQQVMKETGGDAGELSDIIIGASGAMKDPATGAITLTPQPPRWGGVREHLRSRADNAYKLSQAGSKDFPDQGRQQQALYKALNSIHKLYTDKSLELLEKVSPGLAKDIKIDWALAKLGDIAEKNTALNVNQFTPEMNSLTGMRMGNLTPGNIAKNIAAKPAQAGLNVIGRMAAKQGLGMVAGAADKGKIAPMLGMLPGAGAGATGGFMGGMAARGVTGMPSTGPDQAAMTPVQGTPQPQGSLETHAYNMKKGYTDHPIDPALTREINKAFDQTFRDRYAGFPQKEAEARQQFLDGAMEGLHDRVGNLDPIAISRALFSQDVQKQEYFKSAMEQDAAITTAFKNGAFGVTGAILGSPKRYLDKTGASGAYAALKSMVAQVAGPEGARDFDKTMNHPLYTTPQKKMEAIRQLFRVVNAPGWSLYDSVTGGVR